MNVALYEIADMRSILDSWLAEGEGELTPELEALLADLDAKADDKIERVALYIRERQSHAEAVKVERDRLAAIAKREEKAAESLKGYLHREMERLGKTKVNGVLATVALQNNPPRVVGEVPVEALEGWYLDAPRMGFVRFAPATYSLDRKAVLDAHKAGEQIPEGLTVEQTTSIRIR